MAAARVFSVEFRSAVAQRILNGESVMALHAELKIKRSVLYRWRDTYRKFGQDGFKKTRGRPPGAATAATSAVAQPALAATSADRRIADLERRLGRLAMENDFLERAFKRVKEARSKNNATGEVRCTEK
jgi:transposase-like protein